MVTMPDLQDTRAAGLSWRVHPAAERPAVAIGVVALILALGVLAGIWMGSGYWAAFAFLVLFLSLEAFFLPGHFVLDDEGVAVKKAFSNARRPWDQFRRVVMQPGQITLSPFRRRHWLDNYRCLRLPLPPPSAAGPAAEEIRRFVLGHIDPGAVLVEGHVAPFGDVQAEPETRDSIE